VCALLRPFRQTLTAVRETGGLHYLESCPTKELQWAKKRFIEDLTRQRKSGNIAAYLPESPLGRMLRANAPRFALLGAPPAPALANGRIETNAGRVRYTPPQSSNPEALLPASTHRNPALHGDCRDGDCFTYRCRSNSVLGSTWSSR
jgi:hypothetical protein